MRKSLNTSSLRPESSKRTTTKDSGANSIVRISASASNTRNPGIETVAKASGQTAIKPVTDSQAQITTSQLDKDLLFAVGTPSQCIKVKSLIDSGANVRAKHPGDVTALHMAARQGDSDVILLLIKNKANINIKDIYGHTPLYEAISNGNEGAVFSLIEAGANVNDGDEFMSGNTPLHLAAAKGDWKVVNKLLEAHANPCILNCLKKRPVDIAMSGRAKDILEQNTLNSVPEGKKASVKGFSKEEIEKINERIKTLTAEAQSHETQPKALHLAAKKGELLVIKYLITQQDVDVNSADNNDNRPLHYGVKNYDVIKFLLENGAIANLKNYMGDTPLHSLGAYPLELSQFEVILDIFLSQPGVDLETKNRKGRSVLMDSVAYSNASYCEALLNRGANGETKDGNDYTALAQASWIDRRIGVIRALLAKKVNVNAKSKNDYTALHCATLLGKISYVEMLIQAGASVHLKSTDGKTPLHCAAESGYPDVIELLLKEGAFIDAQNEDGATPLHIAIESGNFDTVRQLISLNASLEITDNRGRNAEVVARHMMGKHYFDEEKLITAQNIYDIFNPRQGLLDAVTTSNITRVKKLLKTSNIDVHLQDSNGHTLLQLAAKHGQVEIVNLLFDAGLNIHVEEEKGKTPVLLLAREGNVKVAKLLIDKGAVLHYTDHDGKTVLHHSIEARQISFAQYAIEQGSDVNAKDKMGNNVLHLAAALDGTEFAAFLIEHQVDIKAANHKGETALDIAREHNNHELVTLLENLAATQVKDYTTVPREKMQALLVGANKKGSFKNLAELEQFNGADLRTLIDSHGNTLLHIAIVMMNKDLINLLLESGFNINATNPKNGFTSLHEATTLGNMSIVKFLIQNQANVNVYDNSGRTPFTYAELFNHQDILNELQQIGADVECPQHMGKRLTHSLGIDQKQSIAIQQYSAEDGQQVISFEARGGFANLSSQWLDKYVSSYVQMLKSERSKETGLIDTFVTISETCTFAKNNLGKTQENLARYRSGKPVLIYHSWPKHIVGVALYKDYFVITNRGFDGGPDYATNVYKIQDKSRITAEFLSSLLSEYGVNDKETLINHIAEAIDFSSAIATLSQKPQKHGTCSFVNPKSTINGVLFALEHDANKIKGDLSIKKDAKKHYKEFTAYLRDKAVLEMLDAMKQPSGAKREVACVIGKMFLKQHKYKIDKLDETKENAPALLHDLARGKEISDILVRTNRADITEEELSQAKLAYEKKYDAFVSKGNDESQMVLIFSQKAKPSSPASPETSSGVSLKPKI